MKLEDMPRDPRRPDKHLDPETGIWPICEWGAACTRGFVREERFSRGADLVIKGTDRTKSRKWRARGI
jgi:hypothetical protein